jgi:hypothetical protein
MYSKKLKIKRKFAKYIFDARKLVKNLKNGDKIGGNAYETAEPARARLCLV